MPRTKKTKEKEVVVESEAVEETELVDHVITENDLEDNPELELEGVEVGNIIQLPVGEGEYKLTITMNDETVTIETDDIKGAIMALNPVQFKTKVIIEVERAGKKAQFNLMIARAKMLFRNEMSAILFEKNAKLAVNG